MPDQHPALSGAAVPRLTCSPGKSGNTLAFPYTVENTGPDELFVMDALPAIDPASRSAVANEHASVVICGSDGEVTLG